MRSHKATTESHGAGRAGGGWETGCSCSWGLHPCRSELQWSHSQPNTSSLSMFALSHLFFFLNLYGDKPSQSSINGAFRFPSNLLIGCSHWYSLHICWVRGLSFYVSLTLSHMYLTESGHRCPSALALPACHSLLRNKSPWSSHVFSFCNPPYITLPTLDEKS